MDVLMEVTERKECTRGTERTERERRGVPFNNYLTQIQVCAHWYIYEAKLWSRVNTTAS